MAPTIEQLEHLAQTYTDRLNHLVGDCGAGRCVEPVCQHSSLCQRIVLREACQVLPWCMWGQRQVFQSVHDMHCCVDFKLPAALLMSDDKLYSTLRMLGMSDQQIEHDVRVCDVLLRRLRR